MDFKQRQKTQRNLPECNKKLLQRQNINSQINSRFTPATNLKIGTYVLILNFTTQKRISKKLHPHEKGPNQITDKPTDIQTCRLKQKRNRSKSKQSFTRKSTHCESLLNYTLLQDLKLFKIAQNKIKIKALICTPSKNN